MRMRILGLALLALALLVPATAQAKPRDVEVQLLAINDFHGNLEPPTGSSGRITSAPGASPVDAGGAAYLATHIRQLRETNPNSLVVSAGDLIGASPLLSAAFHDEPTIEAMNEIGLDLNAVGNHEFDEGEAELLRMQYGGCHPTDTAGTCKDADGRFDGANFRFLAANVVRRDTGEPLFPPYEIRKFGNIKVGFIGMTLEGTPDIVSPSGIRNLEFLDEAETANRYAQELRNEHGVRAIVVLLHEGGTPTPFAGINACNVSGPIVDIVNRTDDAVDLFVTGHTHQPYNCVIDGRPVTSASSFGRLVTDIDFTLDRRTKDIENVSANNVIVDRTVERAPDIQALIDRYTTLVAPIRDRVIGNLTAALTRTADNTGESTAGNFVADAQLFDSLGRGRCRGVHEPGRRARRHPRRPGHVRRGVHDAAVRQQPHHDHADRRPAVRDAQAAVVRPAEHADPAPVAHGALHVRRGQGRASARRARPRRTRWCPGSLTINGTPVADSEHLPDHRELVPRRRR